MGASLLTAPMWNFLLVELSGICSLLRFFSFIIAAYFCKIPSYIPSGSVSPATQVFFSPLSVAVLKFCLFFPAWGVGVSEEAGEESKDKGCTLSFFCFASQRAAFQLDYHLSCFELEWGVALRGLSNTVPFFFPHCGQSCGKILKSCVCVCITVHACFSSLPVCVLNLNIYSLI